jgi:hypothetical protein
MPNPSGEEMTREKSRNFIAAPNRHQIQYPKCKDHVEALREKIDSLTAEIAQIQLLK